MFEYIQNRQTTKILKNLEKACDTLQKASASDIQKSWYYQGFLTEKQKQKSIDEQKKIIFKKLQKKSDKEILELAKKLEGGCGVSTFREIFKNCGFLFEEVASGSNFNVFEVRAC